MTKTFIKDVSEGAPQEVERPAQGIPKYPQQAYPGYADDVPSCSKPEGENAGCDAWQYCSTRAEGPYNVVYQNAKGVVNSCHCRLWHYRLKRKGDKYHALDDCWVPTTESIAIDPENVQKGTRRRHYKVFIEDARLPIPGAVVHRIEDYEGVDTSSSLIDSTDGNSSATAPQEPKEFELPPVLDEVHEADPVLKEDKASGDNKKDNQEARDAGAVRNNSNRKGRK